MAAIAYGAGQGTVDQVLVRTNPSTYFANAFVNRNNVITNFANIYYQFGNTRITYIPTGAQADNYGNLNIGNGYFVNDFANVQVINRKLLTQWSNVINRSGTTTITYISTGAQADNYRNLNIDNGYFINNFANSLVISNKLITQWSNLTTRSGTANITYINLGRSSDPGRLATGTSYFDANAVIAFRKILTQTVLLNQVGNANIQASFGVQPDNYRNLNIDNGYFVNDFANSLVISNKLITQWSNLTTRSSTANITYITLGRSSDPNSLNIGMSKLDNNEQIVNNKIGSIFTNAFIRSGSTTSVSILGRSSDVGTLDDGTSKLDNNERITNNKIASVFANAFIRSGSTTSVSILGRSSDVGALDDGTGYFDANATVIRTKIVTQFSNLTSRVGQANLSTGFIIGQSGDPWRVLAVLSNSTVANANAVSANTRTLSSNVTVGTETKATQVEFWSE